jgi:hypothetical protein
VANILNESEFHNLWALVHILSHGEGTMKLYSDGENMEHLQKLEGDLGNIPFHIVSTYAYQDYHEQIVPEMAEVHELMVRKIYRPQP